MERGIAQLTKKQIQAQTIMMQLKLLFRMCEYIDACDYTCIELCDGVDEMFQLNLAKLFALRVIDCWYDFLSLWKIIVFVLCLI